MTATLITYITFIIFLLFLNMSSSTFILEAKNLAQHFNTLTIFSKLNLQINPAERFAIVGRSGSGKSTLLSILAGLSQPSSGAVYFQNRHISNLNEDERALWRAEHIGFVFQDFHLLTSLTALENVMLALELHPTWQKQPLRMLQEHASNVLRQVGLEKRASHYPSQLSGGEQQRVAIARAFAPEPQILFADEPTGSLDSKTAEEIIHLLFELNEKHKTTLVLVTHDLHLAQRCDRQFEMPTPL